MLYSTIGTLPKEKVAYEKLDSDGLPPVGALLTEGDPLYRLEEREEDL